MTRRPVFSRTRGVLAGIAVIVTGLTSSTWGQAGKNVPSEIDVRLVPPPTGVTKVHVGPEKRGAQNAAPLYAEVVKLIPANAGTKWMAQLTEDGVTEEGKAVLKKNREAVEKLLAAGRCDKCRWEESPENEALSVFRDLARLLALEIRFEVAAHRYQAAADALDAGYALARSLAEPGAPLIQGMMGVAIVSLMNEQLLWMLQRPGVPELDFSAIPDRLFDVDALVGQDPSAGRAKVHATRAQRQLDVLRSLETLRSYAARHDSQLPEALPASKAASQPAEAGTIQYRRTGSDTARITLTLPGDEGKQTITYQVRIVQSWARVR